ncbi:3-deoxy-8-phosphooctulonate synthase [Anianabacter salinae]|uniref:3-deoxy-8-phosphooctulonate synthase n=1 Tax=Anianabacter salinae TaxID=2851023 RepID=UPI00225E4D15|nr:3-deoxy-8-phosphooctulonate synthase [Anianabacter salinae]MBV0910971.1 3-deoxy-8-phosphooctulonate synthase [Anianabacter salinae]
MQSVDVGGVSLGNDRALTLIAGPCQLQGADHAQMIAGTLAEACRAAGAGLVFKASFDKANRTSGASARGPGLDAGLAMLASVRAMGIPVTTDVHDAVQCPEVASVVDLIQIPAFLCRQTDLLMAAAGTGRPVNVKKGQFLSPWDMAAVVTKLEAAQAGGIVLTERGSSFGYNALVADMRGLPVMAQTGWPVVMDATHAVQTPGSAGTGTGGDRRFAPMLARAAVSLGIAGVFLETHEDPDSAPSDGANMIALAEMPALIASLMDFDRLAKAAPLRL